jgi:hypothetical protein
MAKAGSALSISTTLRRTSGLYWPALCSSQGRIPFVPYPCEQLFLPMRTSCMGLPITSSTDDRVNRLLFSSWHSVPHVLCGALLARFKEDNGAKALRDKRHPNYTLMLPHLAYTFRRILEPHPRSRSSSSTCTTQRSTWPSRVCEKLNQRPLERISIRDCS